METRILWIHENHTVCPLCGGLVTNKWENLNFTCMDCMTNYICIGKGMADNELEFLVKRRNHGNK